MLQNGSLNSEPLDPLFRTVSAGWRVAKQICVVSLGLGKVVHSHVTDTRANGMAGFFLENHAGTPNPKQRHLHSELRNAKPARFEDAFREMVDTQGGS